MADLKFAMTFEVVGLDAARKQMQDFAKGMSGPSDPGKKAADTARREADATRDVARNRAAASEQARIDATRAERDLRRRAQLERAMSEEARRAASTRVEQARAEIARRERDLRRQAQLERAMVETTRRERAREVVVAREQARIDATRRAAEAKAAREARLQELVRRRELIAQDNARLAAQRNAATERQRMEERVAQSISKRTGRSVQDIVADQRAAGQAAEQASQQATRAESRWRRLGRAMREVRWGRVAGEVTGEIGKQIAKSVSDGIAKGWSQGVSSIRGSNLMSGPRVQGAAGAAKEIGWNAIMGGVSRNQAGMDAENAMQSFLSTEQAREARAAAESAYGTSGNLIPLADNYDAAKALAESGIVADKGLLAAFADTAIARGDSVSNLAKDYQRALKEQDIGAFARERGGEISTDDDGSQTLKYRNRGQEVEHRVMAGDRAGLELAMREFMARDQGAAAGRLATPAGIAQAAMTAGQANIANAMEEPFRKATEWMQRLNDAMIGFDGGAAGFGKKIVEGMDEAERLVTSISTTIRDMVGPVNQVVEGLGGWTTVIGGLVVLNIAGWMMGAAAGIRAVAGASALLASSPAGRVIAGLAAAGYLLNDAWSTEKPAPGSFKAQARAETQAVKDALAAAWSWANTPLNGPKMPPVLAGPGAEIARPIGPAAEVARPVGPAAEFQSADAGMQAREALALMAQVPLAAQTMVAEVNAILAAANFQSHGVAMMETLAAGIRAGAGAAIGAVRGVTQAMRDHLPHSPAKTGPLSDLDRVRFSETLAASIRMDPAVAAVQAVTAGMRAALPAALTMGIGAGIAGPAAAEVPMISPGVLAPARAAGSAGASPVQITYAPVLHIGAGADSGEFMAQLERHKHELVKLLEESQARRSDLKFD